MLHLTSNFSKYKIISTLDINIKENILNLQYSQSFFFHNKNNISYISFIIRFRWFDTNVIMWFEWNEKSEAFLFHSPLLFSICFSSILFLSNNIDVSVLLQTYLIRKKKEKRKFVREVNWKNDVKRREMGIMMRSRKVV